MRIASAEVLEEGGLVSAMRGVLLSRKTFVLMPSCHTIAEAICTPAEL